MSKDSQKHLLLIDAVEWDPIYPTDHLLRGVPIWFGNAMRQATVSLTTIKADQDLRAALSPRPDGIIISGSPRDAWSDDPVNARLCEFLHEVKSLEIPFLGVCYGHQILGRAMGGKVDRHPAGLQLGNVHVTLTNAGMTCPLFEGLPDEPGFICGHADAVLEPPLEAILLASSPVTPVQSFQIGDNMFGVQFHPEFTPEILEFLWRPRIEKWQPRVSIDIGKTLDGLEPVPHSVRVFSNFIDHFMA